MLHIDADDCIGEANRQFNNTNFYKKISNDPAEPNINKVNNTINKLQLQRLLDDKTAENLQTLEVRTPNFFMQPKIHKEGNPDRLVISSANCQITKISQYFDHHLQPHAQELESNGQVSTDFIKKYPQLTRYHKKAF